MCFVCGPVGPPAELATRLTREHHVAQRVGGGGPLTTVGTTSRNPSAVVDPALGQLKAQPTACRTLALDSSSVIMTYFDSE